MYPHSKRDSCCEIFTTQSQEPTHYGLALGKQTCSGPGPLSCNIMKHSAVPIAPLYSLSSAWNALPRPHLPNSLSRQQLNYHLLCKAFPKTQASRTPLPIFILYLLLEHLPRYFIIVYISAIPSRL